MDADRKLLVVDLQGDDHAAALAHLAVGRTKAALLVASVAAIGAIVADGFFVPTRVPLLERRPEDQEMDDGLLAALDEFQARRAVDAAEAKRARRAKKRIGEMR